MGAPNDTVIFLRRGKIERREDAFRIGKSKYSAVRTTGIIIAGGAQITTQAVRLALRNEVPIVYLGGNRILGVTVPFSERYATLRLKQYEIASQPSARLAFARPLIASSILARAAVLEFLANETGITGLEDAADEVRSEAERALNAGSTDALRGYEGRAACRYFRALAEVLPDWAFSGRRTRRPPRDPFNAAISFGYAGVLLPVLLSRTVAAGLEPFLGFLHGPRGRRPGLILDLMEEWRALAVDVPVLRRFLDGSLSREMFRWKGDAVLLRDLDAVSAPVLTVLSRVRGGLLEAVDRRIREVRDGVSRQSPPEPLEFDPEDVGVVWDALEV
ncbi:CRISPR-associated endonuclease Cas1 [Methanopyrus kandleri]|uniref:CRISPR-associated endonuclease Cas1 n=1 Tax=Methanopyrus kandleri (strain AV19 / DSM 6324 / JCM 9639 / NBRC 100938) TaxID=190192 RepID=CAS1_METKA|nr:CRISPR-associated endonuclease Cas1 [Methanopyrus kandleri]Q8TVS6.1 RecName: Full=CRISPR-associated endonuclease Cas1 [Methanopyrus kandleri AV19]AAM02525.1 Uncharacterized conserved protein [Methanopyrus kandleri AV19]